MRQAYMIAATVCLNMREGLAQLRMADVFREQSALFATPVGRLAEVALLWGRAYGHWEAGAVEEVCVPDSKAMAADVAGNPYLEEQLDGLRVGVGEAVRRVADELLAATGEARAADLLAQWEGFARFCRDTLVVEPVVLTAAFGLGDEPGAEVLKTYPSAAAKEAEVARWAAEWTGTWARRFRA